MTLPGSYARFFLYNEPHNIKAQTKDPKKNNRLNLQIYIIFAYYFQTLKQHDERILSIDAAIRFTVQEVPGMVNTVECIVRCL